LLPRIRLQPRALSGPRWFVSSQTHTRGPLSRVRNASGITGDPSDELVGNAPEPTTIRVRAEPACLGVLHTHLEGPETAAVTLSASQAISTVDGVGARTSGPSLDVRANRALGVGTKQRRGPAPESARRLLTPLPCRREKRPGGRRPPFFCLKSPVDPPGPHFFSREFRHDTASLNPPPALRFANHSP